MDRSSFHAVYYSDSPSHYLVQFLKYLSSEMRVTMLFNSDFGVFPHYECDFHDTVDFGYDLAGIETVSLGQGPGANMAVFWFGRRVRKTIQALAPDAVIVTRNNLPCHWQVIFATLSLRIPLRSR